MRRYDDAFPLLAVFALPFRVPISASDRTVNLLVPLYLVVAAGTLVHLLPRLLAGAAPGGVGAAKRSPQPQPQSQAEAPASPSSLRFWRSPRGVQWLLFAAVGLYALQTLYSDDRAKAAENLAFFYLPVRAAVPDPSRRALDARAAAALPRRGGGAGGCCSQAWASSSTTASRCS